MDSPALYNYAPVLRLLLVGGLLALLPLIWWWSRQRRASMPQRLAQLTALTLFLTFDLLLFGAFTRLTDSGLGCPDWPGCYGHASPVGASVHIAQAQQTMPTGPVTFSKAWVEMVHRYLATAVGGLILVLAVVSWRERRRSGVSPVWALVTLLWVCLQGAFGAWTVTLKLFPAMVTLHLLGAMVLLALLRWQTASYARLAGAAPWVWPNGIKPWLWGVLVLVAVQVGLGGWVSTNYAVLACNTFPTCQGRWWPPMDFAAGFELWRTLGHSASGQVLAFDALTAIHYAHRLMAYGVLAALLGLALYLRHRQQHWRQARWLLGLAVWQLLSGLSNVVLDWPLLAALAHTGGAAALVVLLVGWLSAPATPCPVSSRALPSPPLNTGHSA